MRSNIPRGAVCLTVGVLFASTLAGQQADRLDIETGAMAALNKMSVFLRGLKAFQVQSETTQEEVLDDGQKVQFAHRVNLVATRTPDRLIAEVDGDRKKRLFVYDGKSFTLLAQRAGYYATMAAPSEFGGLIDVLDKHDMDIPLVDLFLWGGPRADTKEITSATDVGMGVIGGVTCQHYLFRQPGMDWQIWIQKGDFPLPRKLVLSTTTDDARPQHTEVLTWNLAPSYNDGTFSFTPPPDAKKIIFAGQK
jgi:hypothetical protein